MSKTAQRKVTAYNRGHKEGLKGLDRNIFYSNPKQKFRGHEFSQWNAGFMEGQREHRERVRAGEIPAVIAWEDL